MIVRRQEEKKNIYLVSLPEVGFEPTHPKITELKSAALDHSAIQALEHKEEKKRKKKYLAVDTRECSIPDLNRGCLSHNEES